MAGSPLLTAFAALLLLKSVVARASLLLLQSIILHMNSSCLFLKFNYNLSILSNESKPDFQNKIFSS